MQIGGFNLMTSNLFVNLEKGKSVVSKIDRKIYIVATIFFAVMAATAVWIYQTLKENNEKAPKKGITIIQGPVSEADDEKVTPLFLKSKESKKEGDLRTNEKLMASDQFCETLEVQKEISVKTSLKQQLAITAKDKKEEVKPQMPSVTVEEEVESLVDTEKKEEAAKLQTPYERAEEDEKLLTANHPKQCIPPQPQRQDDMISQKSEAVLDKASTDCFPTPFETLKTMGLYNEEGFDPIIEKVNQALCTPKGERVPPEYAKLQKLVRSDEQLEQLYEEAKVIAHAYSVKDLALDGLVSAADREYKMQYPIILFTNLSTLISGLCKHKQFSEWTS